MNRVYTEPTTEFMFFDELTEEEYKAGMLETNFDNQFLYKMKGKKSRRMKSLSSLRSIRTVIA